MLTKLKDLPKELAKATQDISTRINSIQSEAKIAETSMENTNSFIGDGIKIIAEIGDVLNNVLTSVDDTNNEIAQVATASEEQSSTVKEITTNIDSINEINNENATDIQHVINSAEELNQLAENLLAVISEFKTVTNSDVKMIVQDFLKSEYNKQVVKIIL